MLDPARFLLEAPAVIGRAVYDALLRPAAGAHPDRLACPAPLASTDERVSELAHARGMGEPIRPADPPGWIASIDWGSPLHRLALLPMDVLESLAWYLGLAGEHPSLRRIVLRERLRTLQASGVTADHLAFVYALPQDSSPADPAASAPVEGWPARISRTGWGLIAAAAASLPPPLAWRLRIKLPPDVSPTDGAAAAIVPGDGLFEWVRAQVVAAWQPEFDARLAALAAARD